MGTRKLHQLILHYHQHHHDLPQQNKGQNNTYTGFKSFPWEQQKERVFDSNALKTDAKK